MYVAHKFGGKKQNKEAISHICRNLVKLGVMPISPVHAFGFLNDNVPEERQKGLEFCEKLMESVDALFLCGDWQNSEGCIMERNVALMEMIPLYEVSGWDGDKPVFKRECPKWMKIEGGKKITGDNYENYSTN